jgi:hypothetical protein
MGICRWTSSATFAWVLRIVLRASPRWTCPQVAAMTCSSTCRVTCAEVLGPILIKVPAVTLTKTLRETRTASSAVTLESPLTPGHGPAEAASRPVRLGVT